jgi:sporulation protein YlmC with PRC-barrel domain
MLLTACGGEETSTNVPGTDVPQVTVEATATSELPSATETAMPADETTTPGIPVTGEEDPARLSNQLNFDVWNQDGEQIGEVNDMILDLDNARISYVIVGTGGFLEIGEKDVLVPWDSLELQTGSDDTTAGDRNAFILQTDQEIFNNAPDVDINTVLPEVGQPASDWDLDLRNYWESGVVPATAAPEATAVPDMTATLSPAGTPIAGTVDLQGVVLASEVLGSNVTLSPGQGEGAGQGTGQSQGQYQATVTPGAGPDQATPTADTGQGTGQGVGNFNGTIDDMIVDIDTGNILYVVLDTAFEDGERWIPVPLSFFQWDANDGVLALNVNPAMLRDAPFFQDGQYPDTTVEDWNSEFDAFWQ